MSPDTVIVGDCGCQFLHSNGSSRDTSATEGHMSTAVALVFAVDKNKRHGNFKITSLEIDDFHFSCMI